MDQDLGLATSLLFTTYQLAPSNFHISTLMENEYPKSVTPYLNHKSLHLRNHASTSAISTLPESVVSDDLLHIPFFSEDYFSNNEGLALSLITDHQSSTPSETNTTSYQHHLGIDVQ